MNNYSKKVLQNANLNQSPHITSKTYDFIQKNIERYKKSKQQTRKFISFVNKLPSEVVKKSHLTDNVIQNVSNCGSWLEFRNYFEVDETKLHNANFCKKDKLCPACAMRRASKQVKKVYDYFQQNPELKKKYWYYIVLPVKHNASESFDTVFNRAKDGLKSLRKAINNNRQGVGHKSFFSQFNGLMYSFEVTKTKNGWNNHINLLCCSDRPIKDIYLYTFKNGQKAFQHKGIFEDWAKYTDNKSFMHSINEIDISNEDVLIKNLLEIFKYSLKFQDLKNEDLLEVYEKTHNKRLLGSFGSLYGIKMKVNLNQDDVLDKKFLEIVYRYNFETGEYSEYSRTVKEADCKTRDYGKNIYKYVDVTLCDTGQILTKVAVKQKRVINHYSNIFKKTPISDWQIFKKTMQGLPNST